MIVIKKVLLVMILIFVLIICCCAKREDMPKYVNNEVVQYMSVFYECKLEEYSRIEISEEGSEYGLILNKTHFINFSLIFIIS